MQEHSKRQEREDHYVEVQLEALRKEVVHYIDQAHQDDDQREQPAVVQHIGEGFERKVLSFRLFFDRRLLIGVRSRPEVFHLHDPFLFWPQQEHKQGGDDQIEGDHRQVQRRAERHRRRYLPAENPRVDQKVSVRVQDQRDRTGKAGHPTVARQVNAGDQIPVVDAAHSFSKPAGQNRRDHHPPPAHHTEQRPGGDDKYIDPCRRAYIPG